MSLNIIIFLCCGRGNPVSLLQKTLGDDAKAKSEAFFIYEGRFRADLNGQVSHESENMHEVYAWKQKL